MARDFHTHCPAREIPALVSTKTLLPEEPFCSLERHPWNLPDAWLGLPDGFSALLSRFTALGEIGLDVLHGPEMAVQRCYFQALLPVAQEVHKPVVLHVVRAWQILFEECRAFSLPFLVHGFRGKGEVLTELWKHGFIVCFHPSIVQNEPLLALLRRPQGKFGFESDDDPDTDVRQIIGIVQKKSGNGDLEKISDDCFEEFVSYGRK